MHLKELFIMEEKPDQENDDFAAYARHGNYGAVGAAGSIFLARDTKRILLSHRSADVLEPGQWGTWGGAKEYGETPEEAARREAKEEAGFAGPVQMIPLYVAHGGEGWTYSNFLAIIDREFTPVLNWETQGFRWCRYGRWPQPLHRGLKALLADPASVQTIKKVLAKLDGG